MRARDCWRNGSQFAALQELQAGPLTGLAREHAPWRQTFIIFAMCEPDVTCLEVDFLFLFLGQACAHARSEAVEWTTAEEHGQRTMGAKVARMLCLLLGGVKL